MPGLVLRVNYGGAKIGRALYYVKRPGKDGKQVSIPTTFKLGRYPAFKLKDARRFRDHFQPANLRRFLRRRIVDNRLSPVLTEVTPNKRFRQMRSATNTLLSPHMNRLRIINRNGGALR